MKIKIQSFSFGVILSLQEFIDNDKIGKKYIILRFL